jgi:WW domain-binding protein 2
MSINWVMLDNVTGFVLLPKEQHIWRSPPRTALTLTTPHSYPAQNTLNIDSPSGTLYLTNQRVVYLPEKSRPDFTSFSASLLNLHDTHTIMPWFGPNAWSAVVQPVPGGNIPQENHVELKFTFKEGGAPEYASNFERIKERVQQAVEAARESNLLGSRQAGLSGVNLDSVHLDELPSYENSSMDRIAPSTREPPARTSQPLETPSQPDRPAAAQQQAPSEAPPGYEETQRRSLQEAFERT